MCINLIALSTNPLANPNQTLHSTIEKQNSGGLALEDLESCGTKSSTNCTTLILWGRKPKIYMHLQDECQDFFHTAYVVVVFFWGGGGGGGWGLTSYLP